jgi:hypothetical protein
VTVFDRLAKESGAESFFPRSDDDLKKSLDRISAILQAQYMLAYYPLETGHFRRIEVKVRRGGVRVLARRGASAADAASLVHFDAASCEVPPQDYPYPWETHTTRSASGALVYREDFSSPSSGWPVRREKKAPAPASSSVMQGNATRGPQMARELPSLSSGPTEYQPGLRYLDGGYEIARTQAPEAGSTTSGAVVAYGPVWDDFRASLTVESDWSQSGEEWFGTQPGIVFGLSDSGYCLLLLRGAGEKNKRGLAYAVLRRSLPDGAFSPLIPWTNLTPSPGAPTSRSQPHRLSVERRKNQIAVLVDGQPVPVASAVEDTLRRGLVGLALFGQGRAVFRDLVVETLP